MPTFGKQFLAQAGSSAACDGRDCAATDVVEVDVAALATIASTKREARPGMQILRGNIVNVL